MLGRLHHRRRARQGRVGIFQIGRGVHRTARFTAVAVLVFRAALGAVALNEAVRQEHVLLGIKKLLDGLCCNETRISQAAVDALRQFVVLGSVGAVPIVKGDVEAVEVWLTPSSYVGHKRLWRDTGLSLPQS